MIKPNVLSAGAMIALAASAAFAQTPAAVQQTDSFRQRQQLQSTLPPTGQPEEMAAELYPEENADIGPQSILRLKPRHRWFSATVDAQYYYTDNLFLSDQDTIGTDVLLSALQLAITPPAFALGAGRVAPRLGAQPQQPVLLLVRQRVHAPRLDPRPALLRRGGLPTRGCLRRQASLKVPSHLSSSAPPFRPFLLSVPA